MIRSIRIFFTILMISITLIDAQDVSQVDSVFDNGFGARAKGLGFAQTAFVKDSTAVFWNPSLLHKNSLSNSLLERQSHFGQYTSHFLSHTQLFTDFSLGFGYYNVAISDIIKTNSIGDKQGTSSAGFSRTLIGFSISLARFTTIFDNAHLGLVYDQLNQKLIENKGVAGLLNVGFHYEFSDTLLFGLTYFNVLNGSMSWNTDSKRKEQVPQKLAFGLSYVDSNYSVALDILKKSDQDMRFNIGLEKKVISFFHFDFLGRVGMNYDTLTLGLGLKFAAFTMDYAYQAQQKSYLDNSHFLTFSYWFGYERQLDNHQLNVAKKEPNNVISFSADIKDQIKSINSVNPSLNVKVFDEIVLMPMSVPSLSTVVLLDERAVSPMINLSTANIEPVIPTENLFIDLKDHWIELVATEFYEMSWIKGDELFIPNRAITRYEFAELLVNVFQLKSLKNQLLIITDVNQNDEKYSVVNLVSQKGLFILDSNQRFRPFEFITRAEAMAVIFRLTDLSYIDGVDFPFKDVPERYWARFYIELGLNHDIVMFNDYFYPKRPLTRAEMIGLFSRTPEVIEQVNDSLY